MTPALPISWFLLVGAALFAIGLYGAMSRRNAVNVLMGVELMLNAVNVTAVTFWRYVTPTGDFVVAGQTGRYLAGVDGEAFALFVIALAAAEAAIGLALILAFYRLRRTVEVDAFDALRG